MVINGESRERTKGVYSKTIEIPETFEPLKILFITWNMGRQKILVKPETMFPNSSSQDIIVAGF